MWEERGDKKDRWHCNTELDCYISRNTTPTPRHTYKRGLFQRIFHRNKPTTVCSYSSNEHVSSDQEQGCGNPQQNNTFHKPDIKNNGTDSGCDLIVQPSNMHQALRSFIHMSQFSIGYLLMLMAMYYNGALILTIFFGSFFAYYFFGRDTVLINKAGKASPEACC